MTSWFKRFLTAGAMALALGTAGMALSGPAAAQDKPAAEASAAVTAPAAPAAATAAPAAPAASAAPAPAAEAAAP
ncbi:ammonia channel protein, partial [Cupriavidus gilardii]|nr:ammonia channel protein [Cupriavidus gilardii]